MATISQIRGMLLEEALLRLLRISGYTTVLHPGSDPTLSRVGAGMAVRGRGSDHQIDAIADFLVSHPFSHPQRLLVEAKCYGPAHRVDLPIVRNAVGVLKDVSEFWIPGTAIIPARRRYHYQYALFSASGYTSTAERYAFAQDIFLIPLARTPFLHVLIQSIRQVDHTDFAAEAWDKIEVDLSILRSEVRNALQHRGRVEFRGRDAHNPAIVDRLKAVVDACHQVNKALLAMLSREFPVFLVPNPQINLDELDAFTEVTIHWNSEGWYLRSARDARNLFSFDLPPDLFALYADEGILTASCALDLKSNLLNEIQAFVVSDNSIRLITFGLDHEWLGEVRQHLRTETERREVARRIPEDDDAR